MLVMVSMIVVMSEIRRCQPYIVVNCAKPDHQRGQSKKAKFAAKSHQFGNLVQVEHIVNIPASHVKTLLKCPP